MKQNEFELTTRRLKRLLVMSISITLFLYINEFISDPPPENYSIRQYIMDFFFVCVVIHGVVFMGVLLIHAMIATFLWAVRKLVGNKLFMKLKTHSK